MMTKEEKEAKKKVFIKNGECHVRTQFDLNDISKKMTYQNIK
jgi:hypothetical protein